MFAIFSSFNIIIKNKYLPKNQINYQNNNLTGYLILDKPNGHFKEMVDAVAIISTS